MYSGLENKYSHRTQFGFLGDQSRCSDKGMLIVFRGLNCVHFTRIQSDRQTKVLPIGFFSRTLNLVQVFGEANYRIVI